MPRVELENLICDHIVDNHANPITVSWNISAEFPVSSEKELKLGMKGVCTSPRSKGGECSHNCVEVIIKSELWGDSQVDIEPIQPIEALKGES